MFTHELIYLPSREEQLRFKSIDLNHLTSLGQITSQEMYMLFSISFSLGRKCIALQLLRVLHFFLTRKLAWYVYRRYLSFSSSWSYEPCMLNHVWRVVQDLCGLCCRWWRSTTCASSRCSPGPTWRYSSWSPSPTSSSKTCSKVQILWTILRALRRL